MNEFDQRIRDHRVWAEMQSLGPTIDASISLEELSPEAVLGLGRLRAILAYCGKRIAAAEPLVTALAPLDAIAAYLTAIQNELTAFISDRSEAHITAANGSADGALIMLSQVPGLYSPEELGGLVSATIEYRSEISRALADAKKKLHSFQSQSDQATKTLSEKVEDVSGTLTARADSLQTIFNNLSTTIEIERQKLATIGSEQQGQFSTAQEARSKEFSDSVRLANEGFNKLIAEYQSQFSAAQDARGKEHTAAESGRQTKYNEAIAEYAKKLAEQDADFGKQRTAFVLAAEKELADMFSSYFEKAGVVLADIEEKQRHVEKLVGVIGNLGVTSGYLRAANHARYGMWGWQAATLAALITLSTLAYKTLGLLEDHGGRFNWGGFAGRALLLVSLGVIAAYSGSQADKLFSDEKRNRKLALELEAIGPYLAPLPVEEQNRFRLQIGALSFGQESQPYEHRKSPASVLGLFKSKESKELLSLIIEAATKAKDAK